MKHPLTLWTTSEYATKEFIHAQTDEERIKQVFFSFSHHDMSDSGWAKVGTGEVEVTFSSSEDLMQAAVAAVDVQIENLNTKYLQTLNTLRQTRSELLALPAPQPILEQDNDYI